MLLQLVSHKVLRLVVPFAFALLLVTSTTLALSDSAWLLAAGAQWALWALAFASLYVRLPLVQRFAAALGALLVLNAAAVAGLWRFLFTTDPLWKTWSVQPAAAVGTDVSAQNAVNSVP